MRVVDSLLGAQPKLWEFAGKTGTDEESWNHTEVLIGLRKTRFQVNSVVLYISNVLFFCHFQSLFQISVQSAGV